MLKRIPFLLEGRAETIDTTSEMRYLSLFSGIEAASMGWKPLGWECVAVAEIEPAPCGILNRHYPDVKNLGDVTTISATDIKELGSIDIVVFGSPCQDLSVAGARKGLIDADGNYTRSGLFFTAINIFQWARNHCGARFALWENVPGAYSSGSGKDFAAVVSYMAGLDDLGVPENGWGTEGAAVGDNGMLEWACLDAQWFGVAQRRRRVFAILDTGDWASRPPILLERHSLRGHTPPSRETGEKATGTTTGSLTSSGGGRDSIDNYACGGIGIYSSSSSSSSPLLASGMDLGHGCEALMVFNKQSNCEYDDDDVASTLSARDYKSPTDLIMFNSDAMPDQMNFDPNTASSLTCSQHPAIAYSIITANTNANRLGISEEIAPTLDQSQPPAVAHTQYGEIAGTLTRRYDSSPCSDRGANIVFAKKKGIRRLTPMEYERLQGFTDNYTKIPYKKGFMPDGLRYKALGNSMAVPVMRYIGERIVQAMHYEAISDLC